MFEIACKFLEQLIGYIPYVLGISLIFEYIGMLLFDRR